jgi:hypothetical protein
MNLLARIYAQIQYIRPAAASLALSLALSLVFLASFALLLTPSCLSSHLY